MGKVASFQGIKRIGMAEKTFAGSSKFTWLMLLRALLTQSKSECRTVEALNLGSLSLAPTVAPASVRVGLHGRQENGSGIERVCYST